MGHNAVHFENLFIENVRTNHQVSQKMWFFTLLVKPLGKIRSPLIIVWQQLMPYVHSKGVPLKVELVMRLKPADVIPRGFKRALTPGSCSSRRLTSERAGFWPAEFVLFRLRLVSVVVVLPDLEAVWKRNAFARKLNCGSCCNAKQ